MELVEKKKSEMKNLLSGINGIMNTAEEITSHLEEIAIEKYSN